MFGSKGFAPTGSLDVPAALLWAAMSGAARFSAALPAAADGDSAGKSASRLRIASESSPSSPRSSGVEDAVFRGGDGAFALLDAPAKNAATGLVMVESDACVATPGGALGGGGGAVAT